ATVLLMGTVAADPFNLPPLDCGRINVAFCCTSRIRALCPTECAGVSCGPSFYHTLFSTDGDTNGLVVGAGQQGGPHQWSFQNGKFREEQNGGKPLAIPGEVSNNKDGDATILNPAKAKPFESATTILPALGTQSPYFSGVTAFPTLIPDYQSTLGGGASTVGSWFWLLVLPIRILALSILHTLSPARQPYSPPPPSQVLYVSSLGGPPPDLAEYSTAAPAAMAAGVSTVQPMTQPPPPPPPTTTTTVVPQRTTSKPRRRTTPDPRIIKPPSELVIISEYDEDAPPESQPASVIPSMTAATSAPPVFTSTVATASAAPTETTSEL
ncbi:hypothetical protein PENTCL1PPCAC_18651, partial [Pristionchus entomophagus]